MISHLTLTVKDYDNETYLYLYDLSGRSITTKKLQPEETFSVRLFPGIYIVQLHDLTTNTVESRKVLLY